ncbi:MAG: TlpA family protein disulfide reductase [Acidobacteria bacterium]|nr:TlpA family protein disulfide reductase [Acidobacteriota bacterium]
MRIVRPLLIVAVVVVIYLAFRAPNQEQVRPPERRPALSTFTLAALGGPQWTLADQRGSVVLLNFWATWCPPCRRETPDLVALARTYGSRGLHIAGISMDDDPASVVPAFVGKYHVPYPMLLPDASFSLARSVDSLPTSILLDKQGRVAAIYQGARSAEEFAPAIEHLLAESN